VGALGEAIRIEMEALRKRVLKDAKAEVDGRQLATGAELNEISSELWTQIEHIN
jgi:hypothetical protein